MKAAFLNKVAEIRRGTHGIFVDIKRADYSEYRMASGANLARVLSQIGSSVDFKMITAFRGSDEEEDGSRTPRTKSQNEDDFSGLPNLLRTQLGTRRLGAYWLVGHWTECSVTLGEDEPLTQCEAQGGELVDKLEYSWLITKADPAITSKQWLEAAVGLAKQFSQDGFIIRLEGETTLRNKKGIVQKRLTTERSIQDTWAALAALRGGKEPFGYTELRKLRERGRYQPIVLREQGKQPDVAAKESAYRVQGTGKCFAPEFFVAIPHSNSSKAMFAHLGATWIPEQLPPTPSGGSVWEPNA